MASQEEEGLDEVALKIEPAESFLKFKTRDGR